MTKSHVGMGFSVCPICLTKHDEVVLLDTRLRDSLERENFRGYDLCPEHAAMAGEYIALVEVSNGPAKGDLQMKDANRTGVFVHVRREAAKRIFKTNLPDDLAMVFVEPEVVAELKKLVPPTEGETS